MGRGRYSHTVGLPFGPGAGVAERVSLSGAAASALEVATLLVAIVLLRARGWLRRRPATSTHVRWLTLVSVIAVTALGFAGSGLAGSGGSVGSGDRSVLLSHHQH